LVEQHLLFQCEFSLVLFFSAVKQECEHKLFHEEKKGGTYFILVAMQAK
jgi:hypothetical protein